MEENDKKKKVNSILGVFLSGLLHFLVGITLECSPESSPIAEFSDQ